MKFHKTILSVCALTIASLTAGGALAQQLKAADVHPDGYPNVVAIQNMGKKLEAATKGRIGIKMFANGVLGDEKQEIEQAQLGAIDIIRVSMSPVGAILPEVNAFNLPFIFRDEDHMHKVLDGEIGEELGQKITNSSGKLVFLGWMDAGTRNLITKKPVKNMADLKGLKIRVQGNPVALDTMNAMGANAVSMGVGEVFSAMQTGVVDGAENNPPTFVAHNYLSAGTKYYDLSGHNIIPEVFAFSKPKWEKLSKEDQELIKKFAKEAQAEQRKLWAEYNAKAVETMKKGGVEFVQADRKQFYDATASVRAKYGKDYADLIKRIEAVK